MAIKKRIIRRRRSDSSKAKCQQQNRRKVHLFLKAFEYCRECDADICLMIRLKHNGQVVFFKSDSDWPFPEEQLATHYPKPKQVTWQELAAQYES
ncbi:hypothetical protein BDV32DRAFT_112494 [Aspergillus pseudonomiae]|nr:hypothetical protein BDV32DRAFT_112494 [Aspergillus pseudonomiae]